MSNNLPITQVLTEGEIRAELQKSFARANSDDPEQKTLGHADLTFWQSELLDAGKEHIYGQEYQTYQRKIRGIYSQAN